MIQKCDHPNCDKAGTCRAPKTRELRDYWHFCKEHAAEYNKNWNYYAGLTPEQINEEWERETFGESDADKKKKRREAEDYAQFINNFLNNRGDFDKLKIPKSLPAETRRAFRTLELPITADAREIQAQYRRLAKKHHPDTNKNADASAFAEISAAYKILQKFLGKK